MIKDKAETTSPGKVKTIEQQSLPELPKSKWTFRDELENKSVDVELPAEKQGTREAPTYVMQCGSFRKQDQAEEMKAKIDFLLENPDSIKKITIAGHRKIINGGNSEKDRAKQIINDIKDLN